MKSRPVRTHPQNAADLQKRSRLTIGNGLPHFVVSDRELIVIRAVAFLPRSPQRSSAWALEEHNRFRKTPKQAGPRAAVPLRSNRSPFAIGVMPI